MIGIFYRILEQPCSTSLYDRRPYALTAGSLRAASKTRRRVTKTSRPTAVARFRGALVVVLYVRTRTYHIVQLVRTELSKNFFFGSDFALIWWLAVADLSLRSYPCG